MNQPNPIQKLIRDTHGAGFVEYIILVGLVALIGGVAYRTFGQNVSTAVTNQGTTVSGINAAAP